MFKKVVLTITAVVIAILIIIRSSITISDITVTVEIVHIDQKKETSLYIPKDSDFLTELKLIYDLKIDDGFLYKIDFLDLSEGNAYIAIYINDKYSKYGINNLRLNDNDKVSFIYTEL